MLSGFDRVARIYRWAEYVTFGPFLSRARSAHLSDLATAQHALILGDGDGRFTRLALRTYPQLHVTAIDISPQMLSLLQQRCAPCADRLHIIHADVTIFDLSKIFHPRQSAPDAVVTHFFLDCLTTTQIQTLITQLPTPMRWIVSDFHIPSGILRPISQALVRSLYAAFRILTGLQTQELPDWRQSFRSSGWHLQKQSSVLRSLLIAETWERGATLRTSPASHLSGE
ncbi:MAG: class I SAM-dependent methyltransferase [Acidobacteria bacterium]|nr:class I SAM-dependent methyltransferase [Acidobacteriota bacterium]